MPCQIFVIAVAFVPVWFANVRDELVLLPDLNLIALRAARKPENDEEILIEVLCRLSPIIPPEMTAAPLAKPLIVTLPRMPVWPERPVMAAPSAVMRPETCR